jgi:hypothetical protein
MPEQVAPPPPTKSPTRSVLKWVGKLLASFGFILGVVTGYLSLVPRISVEQPELLDISNPFSTPFILSNDGPLGLNDVDFSCGLNQIENTLHTKVHDSRVTGIARIIRMEPGEKASVPCEFPFGPGPPLISADITMIVKFRPDFVFQRKSRYFRFMTAAAKDGTLRWFPEPSSAGH